MAESLESYNSRQEDAAMGTCIELRKKHNLPIDDLEMIDCEEECPVHKECCGLF